MEAAATERPEAGVDHVQRLAERGDDCGFRFGLRKRRQLVLQAFQVARDRMADHVGAGGEELAELDVSRPQPCQRGGEPVAAFAGAAPLDQAAERHRPFGAERQRPGVDQRQHALAREHEAGAAETEKVGGGGDHAATIYSFQPECSATTPPVICVYDTRRKPACSIILANALGLGNLRIDSTRY